MMKLGCYNSHTLHSVNKMPPRSLHIASRCNGTTADGLTFLYGIEGEVVDSVETCPINTTLGGSPIGRAVCVKDTASGELIWNITINDCGPIRETSEILVDITRDGVTNETVIDVLEIVVEITDTDIDEDDIDNIASIISSSTDLGSGDPMITNLTTTIISDIIDVYEENPSNLEESTEAFTEILMSLETQLDNIDTSDGQPFMALKRNLAVQVSSVRPTDFASGLTISASSTSDDLRDSNITLNSGDSGLDRRQDNMAETRVDIPPGVLNDRADDDEGSSEVRLALTVFRTSSLFSSARVRETNSGQNSFNRSVNSLIVGLAIGGRETTNLIEDIVFHYTPLQPGFENPECNFWDFEDNDWSQRGCRRITSSDDTEEITCSCDHLTNFAVLMDIYAERVEALRIISIIGCTISIVCIIIILITYLSNKNLHKHQSQKIFLCLCGTLLCLYITFLIMTALDRHPDHREVEPVPCGILAALVHFFTLSSLAWMGVEGVNTYLIVVRVFDAYIPRFMLKAGLVAWGGCGLVVLITGLAAMGNYAESDYCFLQRWSAIGGLLIPIALILLANIIIFGLVVRRLFKSANVGSKRDSIPNNRKASNERVKNAISLLILFGLTWVTGYLTLINTTSQVIQTLFIVFNSLQGFFIFVLYCAKNPAVRAYWARMCGCGRNSPKDSTGSHTGRRTSHISSSTNMHEYSSSITRFSQVGKDEDPKNPASNENQTGVHDNPAYEEIEEGVEVSDPTGKYPGKTSNDQSAVGPTYEVIE
nr:adhesion G-protein coupled receptor G6-like [Lytechinus pictus]